MPDVVIHAEFGRGVRQALPDAVRSVLEDAPWTFALFGPDVWFMYQPWKRREGRGRRMHTTRPGAFLMALADRAASLSAPDALFSYLAGFLCHYALDAAAHPYVVYKTEWETKLPRGHMSFEHSLDYRELLRTSRWNGRHPVTSSFLPRCRLPESVRPDIDAVFREVYGWKNCWKGLNAAWKRFRLTYRVIENPNGWFTRLARLSGNARLKSLTYTLSHFNDADVENESHAQWHHSHDESIVSTASFADLRKQALEKALEMIGAAYRYVYHEGITREELAGIIGSRSYLSGLPADDPRNLRIPSLLPPQSAEKLPGGGRV